MREAALQRCVEEGVGVGDSDPKIFRWPAAIPADPEKKSWPSISINLVGSEAFRSFRKDRRRGELEVGRGWWVTTTSIAENRRVILSSTT